MVTVFAFTAAFTLLEAVLWACLGIVGFLGVLALVSPRRFNVCQNGFAGAPVGTVALDTVIQRVALHRLAAGFDDQAADLLDG